MYTVHIYNVHIHSFTPKILKWRENHAGWEPEAHQPVEGVGCLWSVHGPNVFDTQLELVEVERPEVVFVTPPVTTVERVDEDPKSPLAHLHHLRRLMDHHCHQRTLEEHQFLVAWLLFCCVSVNLKLLFYDF